MKRTSCLFTTLLLVVVSFLSGQTIAEKKAGLKKGFTDLDPQTETLLIKFNDELEDKKAELQSLYREVALYHEQDASPEEFQQLLILINQVKKEIKLLNDEWQRVVSRSGKGDIYALWHQPETNIEQMVIDFGSQDYVYVMAPEIAEMKLSINSNIPIPKAAWENMLDLILLQNGIGIRQLNPYLRELYSLEDDQSPVTTITNNKEELNYLPSSERIAFLLAPDPSDVRRIWAFLSKFINPNTTKLEQLGREILIISQVSDVQDLLKLYDFVSTNTSKKQYRLVPLTKIKAEEMAKVISAMFDHIAEEPIIVGEGQTQSSTPGTFSEDYSDVNGLKIIVLESLSQAVFLVGTEEEIDQAEEMIRRVESKIGGPREKVVQWYTVRNSTAEDLAVTLQQVYNAMIQQRAGYTQNGQNGQNGLVRQDDQNDLNQNISIDADPFPDYPRTIFDNSYFLNGEVVIDPTPIGPQPLNINEPQQLANTPNFIVDTKTGSIIMVVEKDLLDKMLEVIARLDIQKKMVQIDCLLYERRLRQQTEYGLNLLRIGSCASNTDKTDFCYDNTLMQGILDFFISRPQDCVKGIAAYDIAYKFLLTQENLSLNCNPSVVTINQTPALISIQEERSISTGVAFIDTTNANTPKETFARAQFGITIQVTPTIHLWNEESGYEDDYDYITLETKVNFDTPAISIDPERPNFIRREIQNEVLIADGQTIVLGGLRRKDQRDQRQAIPFLGEIPGFGKLFSMTELEDDTTEMFIFLTPTIIHDPCEDIERVKFEKFKQRPGDLPSFMYRMNESYECQKRMAFTQSIKILCGQPHTHYYPAQIGCTPASWSRSSHCSCGEWDGRS